MKTIDWILIAVCIIIAIGLITWGVIWFIQNKKKKELNKPEITTPEKEETDKPTILEETVTVSLTAVKRKKNKYNMTGYETDIEVGKRLADLSFEEFQKEGIDDKPYTIKQWADLAGDQEKIEKRNAYEMSILFVYDSNGKIVPETKSMLTRTFKIKK